MKPIERAPPVRTHHPEKFKHSRVILCRTSKIWRDELCKDDGERAGYWGRWWSFTFSPHLISGFSRYPALALERGALLKIIPLLPSSFPSLHHPLFLFSPTILHAPASLTRPHGPLPSGIMGAYGLGSTYRALNNCCSIPAHCTNLSQPPPHFKTLRAWVELSRQHWMGHVVLQTRSYIMDWRKKWCECE